MTRKIYGPATGTPENERAVARLRAHALDSRPKVVRIRAELETGEVLTGPVMGNGGWIGNGAMHAGQARADRQALRALHIAKLRAAEGRRLQIFEPSEGCIAIYPDHGPVSDGERVIIPLAGTEFSIMPPETEL